jgi:hypothetical protein
MKNRLLTGVITLIIASFFCAFSALAAGTNTFPTTLNGYQAGDIIPSSWANSLETKIGVDNSTDTGSIDYKLTNSESVNPGHFHTVAFITDILDYIKGVLQQGWDAAFGSLTAGNVAVTGQVAAEGDICTALNGGKCLSTTGESEQYNYLKLDGSNGPMTGMLRMGSNPIHLNEVSEIPESPGVGAAEIYVRNIDGTTTLIMLENGIEHSYSGGPAGATNLGGLTDVVSPLDYSANMVLQGNGDDSFYSAPLSHSQLLEVGTNSHLDIDSHINNVTNPHSVTAEQTGAVDLISDQTVTGTKTFTTIPNLPDQDPTEPNQAVRLQYVDTFVHMSALWKLPVKSATTTVPPVTATIGDRYLVPASSTGAWATKKDLIANWSGTTWTYDATTTGNAVLSSDSRKAYYYNGTAWVIFNDAPVYGATNGLNYYSGNFKLGGTLTNDTAINGGNYNTTWNLNGTGDFIIQDNGSPRFGVKDNGNVWIGYGDPGFSSVALTVTPKVATDYGLIVKGTAAQSQSLQDWRDSSNNVLLQVGPTGNITSDRYVSETGRGIFMRRRASSTLNNTSGATSSEAMARYVAWKFTPTAPMTPRSIGVTLKKTGTITNNTGGLYAYLYTDNAGAVGSVLSGSNGLGQDKLMYGSLTTSFTSYNLNLRYSGTLASGTSYWIRIYQSELPTGGTVDTYYLTTGTSQWATSTSGTYTYSNGKSGYFSLYGNTGQAVYGYSQQDNAGYFISGIYPAVYGSSVRNYGGYFESTDSYGIRAGSQRNIGGYIYSTDGTGARMTSVNGTAISGASTAGIGIDVDSSSNYAGYFETQSGQAALMAQNNAGTPIISYRNSSVLNSSVETLRVSRDGAGTIANGIGAHISYYIEDKSNTNAEAVRITAYYPDASTTTKDSALFISTITDGGALTQRMTLSNNLTLSNSTGLKLQGSYGWSTNGDYPYNTSSVATDAVRFYTDANFDGGNGDYGVFEKTDGNGTTPDGGLAFTYRGSGGTRNQSMIIKNGNVRIGTATSAIAYKLDVAGTVNATAFYLNGSPFTGGGGSNYWSDSGTVLSPVTSTRIINSDNKYTLKGENAIIHSTSSGSWYLGGAGNDTGLSQYNTAVGTNAMAAIDTGFGHNSAFGFSSLGQLTTGNFNTALGDYSGYGTSDVNYRSTIDIGNLYVGYMASRDNSVSTANALTNASAIGYYAKVAASNTMIFGGTGAYAVNVGINTINPQTRLEIVGTVSSTGLQVNGNANINGTLTVSSLTLGGVTLSAWPTGGDLTFETQQAWTSVFTASRVASTTVTTTVSTSAIGTTTAASIINKLIQWTDSGGTTVKRGWVVNATNAGTVVTIEINGDAVASGDINFRVARVYSPKTWDWYVPGNCVADATNPVGKQYFVSSGTTARLLSTDGNVGTAGVGAAPTLTYNIYDDGATTIGVAPDFSNTANVYDKTFTTTTMAALSRVTLRTPACTFSTTTAADMNVNVYWAPDNWFNY